MLRRVARAPHPTAFAALRRSTSPRKRGEVKEAPHTFPSARKIFPSVNGMSVNGAAPSGRSASLIAFITQAGAPAVPAQAGTRSGFSIRFQYLAAKISVALIPGRAFFTIGI